ncbi:helix-turn-helix transcriptional regulator [Halobacteriaceae archaeon GCM10025711]
MGIKSNNLDEESVAAAMAKHEKIIIQLLAGPIDRRILHKRHKKSRSTVYRGLNELADLELVSESNSTYSLTRFGEQVFLEYRNYLSRVASLVTARRTLGDKVVDELLNPDILVSASVTLAKKPTPNKPIEQIKETINEAAALQGFTPVILPQYVTSFHERIIKGNLTAEVVVEPAVLNSLRNDYSRELNSALETGTLSLFQSTTELSFGLIYVLEPTPRVCIIVYGETGQVLGVIRNNTVESKEWAKSVYQMHRSNAKPINR